MEYVDTGAEALARLQELIPMGCRVHTGSSTTLEQIGFAPWLRGLHHAGQVHYFREASRTIDDPELRIDNRRQALTADYLLGSLNALTLDSVGVCADASGTRISGYIFGPRILI